MSNHICCHSWLNILSGISNYINSNVFIKKKKKNFSESGPVFTDGTTALGQSVFPLFCFYLSLPPYFLHPSYQDGVTAVLITCTTEKYLTRLYPAPPHLVPPGTRESAICVKGNLGILRIRRWPRLPSVCFHTQTLGGTSWFTSDY